MMFTFLLISILCLAGCGTSEEKIMVDSIQISKKNIYLAEGQTAVISAQVYPFNASNQKVVWSSTNDKVVTIEDGFITAHKAGDAIIEVISEEGGYKDTCNVLVTTAENNLALNDYNNLNMPPRELEPIYNSRDYDVQNQTVNNKKTQNTSFSKLTSNKTNNQPVKSSNLKNVTTMANAEVTDDKQVAMSMFEKVKSNLKNSIDSLQQEKELISTTLKNDFSNDFQNFVFNFQSELLDEMKNVKQEIIDSIEQIQEKVQNNEFTVQKQNTDGVTFVMISNMSEKI